MKLNLKRQLLLVAFLPILAIAQEFEWVINPQFEELMPFTDDNLAAAQQNGKWGFIDKTGNFVIMPLFKNVAPFRMGLAGVEQNFKWGFIDLKGNWSIQPIFDKVTNFSEDLAGVTNKDKWSFIDKSGVFINKFKYKHIDPFSEGLAGVGVIVSSNIDYFDPIEKWGFVDKTGAWKIVAQYEKVTNFVDGLAGVCFKDKWGFIDKTGSWVINPTFKQVGPFYEGLAAVRLKDKWGFIDKTGVLVIQPIYDDVNAFSNGSAAVCNGTFWGFIDKAGAWVIQPQFDDAYSFTVNEGLAAVKYRNKWGFIQRPSISIYVKKVVEKNVNEWQKKGEFEKTVDYQNRVNDQNRNSRIQQFTDNAVKQLKAEYIQKIVWGELELSEYDADNETYLIKSKELGDFAVPVSIADAPVFKQNWSNMKFSDSDFSVNSEKFHLAKVVIVNPANNKQYLYDSKQTTTYALNDISYNFAPVEVNFPQNEVVQNNTKISKMTTDIGLSDVDVNIPSLKIINPHAYALIIGNEDYSSYQPDLSNEANVAFAVNDAAIFNKYAIKTLGVAESNIKYLSNATSGQMNQAISWINKIIQKEGGEADVLVYYAGHGLPDEQTHEPYIIPVDVSGTNLQSAIKLQALYNKLTEFPSKKITVFMDACFSGGSRGQGLLATRGIKVKPKEDLLIGNIVVFTSSSGEQSSLPYKDKQHGIFTYFLLKKMQETRGNISYNDLYNYVKKEVDLNCLKVNSKEQTPNLITPIELGQNWQGWKLK